MLRRWIRNQGFLLNRYAWIAVDQVSESHSEFVDDLRFSAESQESE
jgi:hypothetical protein